MELASANLEGESSKISALASELERGIKEALPGSFRNGRAGTRVDHIVSMTVQGVSGETLIAALGRAGVAASVGSACSGTGSGPAQPSYALLAIGLTRQQARSTLRFGLGRFTTLDDINAALHVINNLPFISKR
jgi:cysteine desulfurase